jgi:hypothetical protein
MLRIHQPYQVEHLDIAFSASRQRGIRIESSYQCQVWFLDISEAIAWVFGDEPTLRRAGMLCLILAEARDGLGSPI